MAPPTPRRPDPAAVFSSNSPLPLVVDVSPPALAAASGAADESQEASFDRAARRAERMGCKLYALASGRFLLSHRAMGHELPDLRAVNALLEQAP
jgi:hypothetical protein